MVRKTLKISLLDESGTEIDYVTREIITWDEYNFAKGILVDCYLLLSRRSLLTAWMREQFKKTRFLDTDLD
jgi:hypothetical protein